MTSVMLGKDEAKTIRRRGGPRILWRLLHVVLYLLLLIPVVGGGANFAEDALLTRPIAWPDAIIDATGAVLGSWGMVALFRRRLDDMGRARWIALLVTGLHVAMSLCWAPPTHPDLESHRMLIGLFGMPALAGAFLLVAVPTRWLRRR